MVKVATWNLWWRYGDWQARQSVITDELRALNADIVGLQQVWHTRENNGAAQLAEALGYQLAFAALPAPEKWQQKLGDASVGIGNAVLSRWPIVQTATVQLPPGEAADEGRSSRGTGMTPIARDAMWTSRRGLFFLRVNAASTHIYYPHTVVDRNACGGITIRDDDGPKQGLPVHFYSHDEPIRLTDAAFESVLALREERIRRTLPQTGFWTQWEAIWKKQDRT